MQMPEILPVSFYNQPVLALARNLIGKMLVREVDGVYLSGVIVETEAYIGEEDLACHARAGRTERTAVMYGLPGHAYIYFTYGMHWLLNCTAGEEGYPAAVLIRALKPLSGLEIIRQNRRNRPQAEWCNGPGKICQAFQIDGGLNGINLGDRRSGLRFCQGGEIPDEFVKITSRIGIDSVPEPWRSKPWRFNAGIPAGWLPDGV